MKDDRYPKRSEMRFWKTIPGEDVFIKIRVELVNLTHVYGGNYIYVMSFHYSEREFEEKDFPFKKN